MVRVYTYLLLSIFLLTSCSNKEKSSEKEGVEAVLPAQVNEVTVMTLKKTAFNHELVSNGKVTASKYADLSFRVTSEPVAHIYVKNGDFVKKGQKIAELDLFALRNSMEKAEIALRQSELEMKDVLIGQGYAPDRMKDIPKDVVYGMAFIHDIGRAAQYRDGTDHALAGKRLAQQILPEAGYSSEEAGWICGAVAGHRSTQKTDGMQAEMMPKDPAWKLAEILYQADKLSRRCYDCPASGACYWPEDRKIQTIIY